MRKKHLAGQLIYISASSKVLIFQAIGGSRFPTVDRRNPAPVEVGS